MINSIPAVDSNIINRPLFQIDGERFTSRVLDNLSCPVFVTNPDTSITYVNASLERLTSFTSTELIGCKSPYLWCTVPHNDKKHKEALRNSVESQMQFRKKNGERFWVENTSIPIEYEGKPYSLITWTDITATRQLNEAMELYLTELTRSQEEERKQIAHVLQDGLVQSLSALNLDIDALASHTAQLPEELTSKLEKLRMRVSAIADEARSYSYALHPGVFDYLGLQEALELLVGDMNNEGITASLTVNGSERPVQHDRQVYLFRIAQAALDNVKKHAQATAVSIMVRFTSDKIQMEITDNGRGFVTPEPLSETARLGKMGLFVMRERCRICGGVFSVKSQPGRGTKVVVTIPTV